MKMIPDEVVQAVVWPKFDEQKVTRNMLADAEELLELTKNLLNVLKQTGDTFFFTINTFDDTVWATIGPRSNMKNFAQLPVRTMTCADGHALVFFWNHAGLTLEFRRYPYDNWETKLFAIIAQAQEKGDEDKVERMLDRFATGLADPNRRELEPVGVCMHCKSELFDGDEAYLDGDGQYYCSLECLAWALDVVRITVKEEE